MPQEVIELNNEDGAACAPEADTRTNTVYHVHRDLSNGCKFERHIILGGVDKPEGHDAIQRNLDGLDTWVDSHNCSYYSSTIIALEERENV